MAKKLDVQSATQAELFKTPDIPGRIRLWGYQWFGVFFLFLIPVLALFGVFGEGTKEMRETAQGLEAVIRYPTVARYGQSGSLQIELINRSDQAMDDLKTVFTADYIHQFSDVSFVPESIRTYEVHVGTLAPGRSRFVLVQMKANQYGRHDGEVRVLNSTSDLMSVPVRTVVFP